MPRSPLWTAVPRRALPAALAAALGLCATGARAQDNDRLPSLSARVFEVRGPVRVSLPQIERQPLSGFGPALPVFTVGPRVAADRPFTPDLEALPDLSVPPPAEPPVSLVEVTENRLEGGAGSRLSRYGRADLAFGGAAGQFYVDADYDGLSVSDDAALTQSLVDFDHVEVRAGGQSFAPGRFRLDAHALLDAYALPAVALPDTRRGRRHVGLEAGVSGVGALPYRATVGFANARLGQTGGVANETTENRVDGSVEAAFLDRTVRVDVAGGTSGLEGSVGSDLQYGAAGVAVAIERPSGLRLVVGARGLAYRTTELAREGDSRQIGPIVDLQVPLGSLRAFVTNDPRLAVRSVTSLSQENPYVAGPLALSPDVLPIDARGGVELDAGALRARGYATALYAPVFLVYERLGSGLYAQDLVSARSVGFGGDAVLTLASGIGLSAGVEVRSGSTSDGDELPYFAPVIGRASVAVPFSRGRVGLTAYGESPRALDRSAQQETDAWGRLELDLRVDVTEPVSVVVRGQRLLGTQERWPGFRDPGFAIQAGARLTW